MALAVLVFGSTGGEIAITYGMKATGEPQRLAPREILQFLGRAFRNGWFWAGVPLMALSFYSLLLLLSWEPISLVIPASALSYVVGTFGAKYILGEDVTVARWAGVVLVCLGVALVAAG
jgi:drug/metabolite transporter (DMT)-like permease